MESEVDKKLDAKQARTDLYARAGLEREQHSSEEDVVRSQVPLMARSTRCRKSPFPDCSQDFSAFIEQCSVNLRPSCHSVRRNARTASAAWAIWGCRVH